LKKEMQKNEVSALGTREVRWKGQGEIKSSDHTMYYSGGERNENGVAREVHKSVERSLLRRLLIVTE
jgi:hypothetical protein